MAIIICQQGDTYQDLGPLYSNFNLLILTGATHNTLARLKNQKRAFKNKTVKMISF